MSGLCAIAIDAINGALRDGARRLPDLAGLDPVFTRPGASFVTLERDDELLGCVGTLDAVRPLAHDVADRALAAAFDDPRVPPVTVDDVAVMSVKVSVLSPSTALAVDSYDDLAASLRPGVDGVVLTIGSRRTTLLPSVWSKVAGVDEFLAALWQKAGIQPSRFASCMGVSTYTTVEFVDPGPRDFRPSLGDARLS